MNSQTLKYSWLCVVAFFTAFLVLSPISRADTGVKRDVLVDASSDLYWVVRVQPDEQPQHVESIVQFRSIGSSPQWKQIAEIGQRVTSVANFSGRLAVLLEDGDWMTTSDQDTAAGPLPEDGSRLIALGGDQQGGTIWAIASAGKGRIPTTAGTTQPAISLPADQRLLYHLERGRWQFIAPIPAEIATMQNISLIGGADPLIAAMNDAGVVRAFAWHDKAWADAGTFTASTGASQIKLLDISGRQALWLADDNGNGELRMRSSATDMAWSQHTSLQLPASAPQGAASDIAAAGGKVRVVLFAPDGKLSEYSFAPAGGTPEQALIPAAAAEEEPRAFEVISATAAALLMIVLINTMRQRDDHGAIEAVQAGTLQLAPYGLRLLAGLIDALPWIGTMMIIFLRSQAQQSPQEIAEANEALIFIALAIYVLHTLVSEALWGWTIGKKLCGLRVITLDGSPPGVRAAVLRNILRIVDVTLSFLPTLFILISPLRQRTGDIAANTIVIKDGPAKETTG